PPLLLLGWRASVYLCEPSIDQLRIPRDRYPDFGSDVRDGQECCCDGHCPNRRTV
ncbi:hypothetical protein AtubIFM55763_006785, partial [Aspergillus tubingensis]